MAVIGMMLVRNEQGRWLATVLSQMIALCDRVIVVDDASTDGTPNVCRSLGAEVHLTESQTWTVNEVQQRKRCWELAVHAAGQGGWVLCLDADEVLEPKALACLPDIIRRAEVAGADGLGFHLYDMWDAQHYRDDGRWSRHRGMRTMALRIDPRREYRWRETRLHCGRLPANGAERLFPSGLRIQHWGWSTPEERHRKLAVYRRVDRAPTRNQRSHYASILDPSPRLAVWVP